MCPAPPHNSVPSRDLGLGVRPVRKAFEQVADQLRELIITRQLGPGSRLPNEIALARNFAVSRTTVREALRLLAAQDLIRTEKGPGGGSFVTLPTVDHISDFLQASIGLLTETEDVSLEEFLEARELLEIQAARLAASKRTDEDVERLRATIPIHPADMPIDEQFVLNRAFHSIMVEMARNTLIFIATQPVFSILQTHLARSTRGPAFHEALQQHHVLIADAVAAGDPDAAEHEMREHLAFLRPAYEQTWQHLRSGHVALTSDIIPSA